MTPETKRRLFVPDAVIQNLVNGITAGELAQRLNISAGERDRLESVALENIAEARRVLALQTAAARALGVMLGIAGTVLTLFAIGVL